MIKISTREFVNMLKDVSPFASTDADTPNNVVRVEYDGDRLAISATDRVRVARETWTPDDEQYDAAAEEAYAIYEVEPGTPLFSLRIALDDIKSIIKAFTIKGNKRQYAPLTLTVKEASFEDNTYTLKIVREKDEQWAALSMYPTGYGAPREGEYPEPDFESLIASKQGIEAHLPGVMFGAAMLGAFGKVRDLGPLEFEFTGEYEVVRFNMGKRFTGLIQPMKPATADEHARAEKPASDFLRHGSGVHLATVPDEDIDY